MKQFAIALLVFLTFAASEVNAAVDPIKCDKKFDFNENGLVEFGREFEVCNIHQLNEFYRNNDKNLDGRVSAEELAAFEKKALTKAREIASLHRQDLLDADQSATGIKPHVKPKPKDRRTEEVFGSKQGVILRKAYEAAGLINIPKNEIKKVPGADFTYIHDFATRNDIKSATGSVSAY